jgi:AraC family transcriptional regulator, positive regulator of tynA and feaB
MLVDPARPLTILREHGFAEQLALHLPRQQLVSHLGYEPQNALWQGRALPARLLFQLVMEAVTNPEPTPPRVETHMQLAVYDLLGATFAAPDHRFVSTHTTELFKQVWAIIEGRFTDTELNPADVAAEARISLRYMQKLFAARGVTYGHLIQSLRLEHAARLLQRRALLDTSRPLNQIAYASGFRDYAYFCRKFHERFGHPPSAYAGAKEDGT